MKIICTKAEKERLMTSIHDFFNCSPYCKEDCDKCVEGSLKQEIEWEVIDNGEQG